jgi:hypothetical protein
VALAAKGVAWPGDNLSPPKGESGAPADYTQYRNQFIDAAYNTKDLMIPQMRRVLSAREMRIVDSISVEFSRSENISRAYATREGRPRIEISFGLLNVLAQISDGIALCGIADPSGRMQCPSKIRPYVRYLADLAVDNAQAKRSGRSLRGRT